MQNIEEQAGATYAWSFPLWLCYVDDTVTAVHKDEIDDFHEHLNRQKVDIKFSKEIEENGKIPFLDRLVTCNNNRLRMTIYRKHVPTNYTRPVIVQPNLSQCYNNFDKTSTTRLRLAWQPSKQD